MQKYDVGQNRPLWWLIVRWGSYNRKTSFLPLTAIHLANVQIFMAMPNNRFQLASDVVADTYRSYESLHFIGCWMYHPRPVTWS